MKIRKHKGPVTKLLGDLKVGDLFERADVQTPCTTYMVVRHDRTVTIEPTGKLDCSCSYVVDLRNATVKMMYDDCSTVPLEQDNEIVVREL